MKKILIFDRMDSKKFPGGDTVQISAIANYLKEKGHDVKITSDLFTDLTDMDVVFIFNLTNPIEAYLQAKIANKYEKPFILFPVYWNLDELKIPYWSYKSILKNILPNWVKSLIRSLNFGFSHKAILKKLKISNFQFCSSRKMTQYTLDHAKYVCPNSEAELNYLLSEFPIEGLKEKCRIVFNGVDYKKVKDSLSYNERLKTDLPERYICCIGGIGPRKNQLNLVKAFNGFSNTSLLIIGRVARKHETYFEKVKRVAGKNVIFLDHVPQHEVFKIMANSIGHIQPSYIETPGLASLEAASLGRPIVVSDVPPVKEYFQKDALYCNPYEIKSIRRCIEKLIAMPTQSNKKLQDNIRDQYDWSVVLKKIDSLL